MQAPEIVWLFSAELYLHFQPIFKMKRWSTDLSVICKHIVGSLNSILN